MGIQIIMFLLVTVIALILFKITRKEDEATKLARLKKLKEKEEIKLYKSIRNNNKNIYNQNTCCENNITNSVTFEQFETNPVNGLYICGGVDSMGNSYGYDNH